MADDIPAVPQEGICAKIAFLWLTNKPLAIFLLVLLFLIGLGIIFLVLWFLVFSKNTGNSTPSSTTAAAHAATATFLHLRSLVA